eukprot:9492278-Pyramimonas_sp.AAC.1
MAERGWADSSGLPEAPERPARASRPCRFSAAPRAWLAFRAVLSEVAAEGQDPELGLLCSLSGHCLRAAAVVDDLGASVAAGP